MFSSPPCFCAFTGPSLLDMKFFFLETFSLVSVLLGFLSHLSKELVSPPSTISHYRLTWLSLATNTFCAGDKHFGAGDKHILCGKQTLLCLRQHVENACSNFIHTHTHTPTHTHTHTCTHTHMHTHSDFHTGHVEMIANHKYSPLKTGVFTLQRSKGIYR